MLTKGLLRLPSTRRAARERGKPVSSPTHVRWGETAAILGGVLFATWGYIHRDDAPSYLIAIASTLAFTVPLLLLAALAGLYVRCRGRVGWLGGTGFAFGFVGSAWGSMDSVVDMSSWHLYVSSKDWLPLLLGWLPLLCLGLMIVGITILGRNATDGLGALLFAIGGSGWAYCFTEKASGGLIEVRWAHVVFGVLFCLGWVVLGYALWRGKGNCSNS
jgi:hypothetical protein